MTYHSAQGCLGKQNLQKSANLLGFFQSKWDQIPTYTVNSNGRNPRKMYQLKYFRQTEQWYLIFHCATRILRISSRTGEKRLLLEAMKYTPASCSWWHLESQTVVVGLFICLLLLMLLIYRERVWSLPYSPIPYPPRGTVHFPGKERGNDLPNLKAAVHINLMAIAVSQGARNWNFAMLKDTGSLISEPGDRSECDLTPNKQGFNHSSLTVKQNCFPPNSVWLTADTSFSLL